MSCCYSKSASVLYITAVSIFYVCSKILRCWSLGRKNGTTFLLKSASRKRTRFIMGRRNYCTKKKNSLKTSIFFHRVGFGAKHWDWRLLSYMRNKHLLTNNLQKDPRYRCTRRSEWLVVTIETGTEFRQHCCKRKGIRAWCNRTRGKESALELEKKFEKTNLGNGNVISWKNTTGTWWPLNALIHTWRRRG